MWRARLSFFVDGPSLDCDGDKSLHLSPDQKTKVVFFVGELAPRLWWWK